MPLDWMDVQAAGAAGADALAPRPSVVLDDLNDAQRAAVTHPEGPLLVLAGAGTGKTRVITRRIAWLVETARALSDEVLAITFTNKAAGEMRSRCAAFFPVKGLWISTFHAMGARILRREIEALGGWTRDFSIYDTYERNQLLKEIVQELGYDPQRFRPAMLGAWISSEKNRRFEGSQGGGEAVPVLS